MGQCGSNSNNASVKPAAKNAGETNDKSSATEANSLPIAPVPITRKNTKDSAPVVLDNDQPGVRNLKNAVGRVMDVKRMWTRFWTQLDEAEERDLFLMSEVENVVRDSLTGDNVASSSGLKLKPQSVNTGVRVKRGDVRSRPTSPSSVRMVEIDGTDARDVYSHARFPQPSSAFLRQLGNVQSQYRQEMSIAPGPGEFIGEYEVADVPPLDQDTVITQAWIDRLVSAVKNEKLISPQDAFFIQTKAIATFLDKPNVQPVQVPAGTQMTVVGDLHGQVDDLFMALREAGRPNEKSYILFNGDFVDRGKYSCECMLIIMAYRAAFPNFVFVNRGNHEFSDICKLDGFLEECKRKYKSSLFWQFCNHVFATVPIAHTISIGKQRVFVVHAGLSFEDITIADINREDRFYTRYPLNSILQDLVWSDPYLGSGRIISKRGAGCMFGADVCARFLIRNQMHLIIRSHECEDNGFALWFDNRLYTIFSASDYCGDSGNYGAVCILNDNPSPQIRVYMAKKQILKYSDRQKRMRQTLVSKLLVRLANRIFDIEMKMNEMADANGYISPIKWSFCLQTCSGVDAPFRCISRRLGVKDDSKPIHVASWCAKFKPKAALSVTTPEEKLKYRIGGLLYDPTSPFKSALESLFTHFDVDGDGSISLEEFNSGLMSLINILNIQVTDEEVEALVRLIDANQDGEIDYNEFFNAFAYGHVDTSEIELEDHDI